jgi:hypothetical protein
MFSMPPSDGRLREAEPDLLGGGGDRLGAGTTNTVDRHGRHVDRHTAMDGGLAGRIHPVPRLDHVAHDDCAELRRIEIGAAERLADDCRPELGRGRRLQRTIIGSNRGTDRSAEYGFSFGHADFLHESSLTITPPCRSGGGIRGRLQFRAARTPGRCRTRLPLRLRTDRAGRRRDGAFVPDREPAGAYSPAKSKAGMPFCAIAGIRMPAAAYNTVDLSSPI